MKTITAAALPLLLIFSFAIFFQGHIPRFGRNDARLRQPPSRLDLFRAGAHAGPRPVYPYSVLSGGAYDGAELRKKASSDDIAMRHYHQIRLDLLRRVEAISRMVVYVSYRKGNSIYWTRKPIQLPKGEALLTDGALYVRARCGNRISTTPQSPVSETEPSKEMLDIPEYWQGIPFPADPELPWQEKTRLSAMLDPNLTGHAPRGLGVLPAGSGLLIARRGDSSNPGGGDFPGTSGSGWPGDGNFPGFPAGKGGSGTPGSSGSGPTGGGGGEHSGPPGSGGPGGGGGETPGPPGPGGPGGGSEHPGPPGPGGPGGGGSGTPGGPGGDPKGPGPNGPNPGNDLPIAPIPEPGSVALLLTAVAATAGVRIWNSRRAGRTRR